MFRSYFKCFLKIDVQNVYLTKNLKKTANIKTRKYKSIYEIKTEDIYICIKYLKI